MSTKLNSTRYTGGISHEEYGSTELLVNPFVHRLELETTYEKIKVTTLKISATKSKRISRMWKCYVWIIWMY